MKDTKTLYHTVVVEGVGNGSLASHTVTTEAEENSSETTQALQRITENKDAVFDLFGIFFFFSVIILCLCVAYVLYMHT